MTLTAKSREPRSGSAAQLRASRQLLPPRPFEELGDGGLDLELLRRDGWRRGIHRMRILPEPESWENPPTRDMGWRLHAWEPLEPFLLAAQADDTQAFQDMLRICLSWIDAYADGQREAGSFAWYDMSFAWRAHRLAFLLDMACRRRDVPDAAIAAMARMLEQHFALLLHEQEFHDHNNHGFYQAVTALAAARRWRELEGAADLLEVSHERLSRLLDTLIDRDGVLREHSPGYQFHVLRLLERATTANLLSPEQVARQAAMGRALAWLVMPDGNFAPFGDTEPGLAAGNGDGGALIFHRNAYRRPEGARDKLFAEAGLWVGRDGDSALAVHAGFHSMTHKHADHGTLVWYEDGKPLLIEAGFFPYEGRTAEGSSRRREGFYYSDPRRIHVESTRAHNCVEIGGESYARRGVGFFGSAIRSAAFDTSGAILSMGFRHPGGIRHERLLVWQPRRFLLVLDRLQAPAPLPGLRQWFHLAPDLELTPDGPGWRSPGLSLTSLMPGTGSVGPLTGATEPEFQGWHGASTGELTPHPAVAFTTSGGLQAFFATLLVPKDNLPAILSDGTFLGTSGNGTLRWQDAEGEVEVAILDTEGMLDAAFTPRR